MYDELVKMLRVCGDSNNSCGNCPIRENDGSCPHGEWEFAAEKYMLQAADAIEELQAAEKKFLANISALEAENQHLKRERDWIPVTERLPKMLDGENISKELVNAFNMGLKAGREEADSTLRERLTLCRNELCLRCGSYKNAHNGACDGCRWKENYA